MNEQLPNEELTDIGAEIKRSPQPPPLEIAILIVGSRGDVQVSIPIGLRLARDGHRVRLATHAVFRDLVESNGLEFYPLGGDPVELMSYMVKTEGRVIPRKLHQIVKEVPEKRQMLKEIVASTWLACTEKDPDREDQDPFLADAIIANPPSYGHIHIAEALHIPLQIIFTMPWTPTSEFPHPLSNLPYGKKMPGRNFFSYVINDILVWAGMADIINDFRKNTLGLDTVPRMRGASLLLDYGVPHTYLWPPALIPKPADWGSLIEVTGFSLLGQASNYKPPQGLRDFLAAGEKPIYVGFGSCPVSDPAAVTRTVFEALSSAGARGIVSKGWANLGNEDVPDNVYLIEECPHDWLFKHCAAVCHHGGAGTTAAGLREGLPTVVVPFFGDQRFWAYIVYRSGAGPQPIPIKELTPLKLAEAFAFCLTAEARERAGALGESVRQRPGDQLAVEGFYRHLSIETMMCKHNPSHLTRRFCETCAIQICEDCDDAVHRGTPKAGHERFPCTYVEWSPQRAQGTKELLKHAIGLLASDALLKLETAAARLGSSIRRGVVQVSRKAGDIQEHFRT